MSLRMKESTASLWISQPCGLGRIYPLAVLAVSVRRSGEEGGTHGTHRTHGTVADGTKGHAGSPAAQPPFLSILRILWFLSLRWQSFACTSAHAGSALHVSQMRWLFVGEA